MVAALVMWALGVSAVLVYLFSRMQRVGPASLATELDDKTTP